MFILQYDYKVDLYIRA